MVPQLQKQLHGSDFTALLDRAAFVNIDSQNRILHPEGVLAREEIRKGERVPGGCLHDTLPSAGMPRAQQMAVIGRDGGAQAYDPR